MTVSLEAFTNGNTGQRLANPDGSYKGECVSLVQQYLYQCLGIPYVARGNAHQWRSSLVYAGIAYEVTGTPQRGDIIVYDTRYGGGYGHIGIADGNGNLFDQNNYMNGRNGTAGKIRLYGSYAIMRTYKQAPYDNANTNRKKIYTIDEIGKHHGVWQIRCNYLVPVEFNWLENGIALSDITFVDGKGNPVASFYDGSQKYFVFDDGIKATGGAGYGSGGYYWTQYSTIGGNIWLSAWDRNHLMYK